MLIVKYLSKIDIWINICSNVMHSHLQLFRMLYYFPEENIKFYHELNKSVTLLYALHNISMN